VVAVSGRNGGAYSQAGLEVDQALEHLAKQGSDKDSIKQLADCQFISNEDLLQLDVDILIPAAIGGVIHEDNADQVKAALIVEAANMPLTCKADSILQERGVAIIPDILANAGGVTVSYLEWVQNRQRYQWSRERTLEELEKRLTQAWQETCRRAQKENLSYRLAAYVVAVERIIEAIKLRGF
jgi:glutamate dehydrogenase (NAD(P)+)